MLRRTTRFLLCIAFLFAWLIVPMMTHAAPDSAYLTRGTAKVLQMLARWNNRKTLTFPNVTPMRIPPRPAAPVSRFIPQKNYRRGGGGSGGANRTEGSGDTSSSSVNLIAPTITFSDLTKSHIDANFTLSPTSDSPGAFTFTSGDTSLVTISGNTADVVGVYGTATITAHQAASGNYAASDKAMTLTVFYTYCVSDPCTNGGTCVPTLQGLLTDNNYVCECPDHYSGIDCFMHDLNCSENGGDLFCFNGGNCLPSEDGGECDCVNGFCGTRCTILPSQCD